MKVYVVDDSKLLRDKMTELLADMPEVDIVGYAERIDEATEGIKAQKPDVVILDIRLANGSGIDVLHEIKSGENPPYVLIFTGYPYPHYKQRCLDEGADYFFSKSSDLDEMIDQLDMLTLKFGD